MSAQYEYFCYSVASAALVLILSFHGYRMTLKSYVSLNEHLMKFNVAWVFLSMTRYDHYTVDWVMWRQHINDTPQTCGARGYPEFQGDD